jgi:hypothetical protein
VVAEGHSPMEVDIEVVPGIVVDAKVTLRR